MRRVALVSSSMLILLACARFHGEGSGDGQQCHWRLGDAVEIGRAERIESLAGAVHGTHDVALVIASAEGRGLGGGGLGALVTTTERPERLGSFEPSLPTVLSTESGFALFAYPDCTIELLGADLAPMGAVDLAGDTPTPFCHLSQTVAGRVEVAVSEGLGGPTTIHSVSRLGTAEQSVEDLAVVGTADATALRVVHQPEWGTWVWVNGPRGFAMERLDGASPIVADWAAPGGLRGSTADDLRGGIVVLARRDPPSGDWGDWQLEWFGPEGELGSPIVTPLPGVWPFEEPASAGDGAFIPLHGGTLAFVRWGEPEMQILRHEDSERVLQSRALVRPGGDRGGLLYSMDDGGMIALRWRSLVCER